MVAAAEMLTGTWVNEYGSIMKIDLTESGTFTGNYSSTTGDTGTYKVVGAFDTDPNSNQVGISFAISWRSNGDNSGSEFCHSTSGFSGQIQLNGSQTIMPVIHILSTPHSAGDRWQNSLVDKLTFVKQEG